VRLKQRKCVLTNRARIVNMKRPLRSKPNRPDLLGHHVNVTDYRARPNKGFGLNQYSFVVFAAERRNAAGSASPGTPFLVRLAALFHYAANNTDFCNADQVRVLAKRPFTGAILGVIGQVDEFVSSIGRAFRYGSRKSLSKELLDCLPSHIRLIDRCVHVGLYLLRAQRPVVDADFVY
jgi:hypothetical protein